MDLKREAIREVESAPNSRYYFTNRLNTTPDMIPGLLSPTHCAYYYLELIWKGVPMEKVIARQGINIGI